MSMRAKTLASKRVIRCLTLVIFFTIIPNTLQKTFSAQIPDEFDHSTGKLTEWLKADINPRLLIALREKLPKYLPITKRKVITIIDFTLPSTEKRLWTVNLETTETLFHSLVAHGKNTGITYAEQFSNTPGSNQSSLGFYLTDKSYTGKHGRSLRLKGLEKNLNDRAYDRAIVVHGAEYATEAFIEKHGRLGRSFGCPALPPKITDAFIDTVKDGSLLFIYHSDYEGM